ncbi:gluconate 2-dehydrogenase subunit 3 family protein [Larkinella sp. GY13]|uniref:gluconate 2-dehydrogenase subunit 3 family protein n=1 Tax=Larkinella sp. GY13 TaxID=3453720 RepID=UPI003EEB8B71
MELLTRQEKSFFTILRELTIVGYFTSETGASQALDYVAIPGRFVGDIPLKPGQRAWAI